MRALCMMMVLVLSACSYTSRKESMASGWDDECYSGYEADVLVLSGRSARDCGLLSRKKRSADGPEKDCLRQMIPTASPFRVAHASHGDDSLFCDSAIRDESGVYWSLFYDFDVTGQMSGSGENAAIWVSRCTGLVLEPGTIGPGSFFHLQGCEEDRAALDRIMGARTQNDK